MRFAASPRLRSVFLAWAGALPLVGLVLWFRLFNLVASQVAWPRALGLAAVFAALMLAVAVPLTAVTLALRLDREAWRRGWRVMFYGAALANLAMVGLIVFWGNPRLAPAPVLAGVGALLVAMGVAFWRYGEPEQTFVTRLVRGLGLGLLAVPLAATPLVAWAAFHDQARLPESPLPPAPSAPKPGAPERVVLVTFDSLRARSTAMVTPGRHTPALSAMAQESTYYGNYHASSDRTLAAVPSLLSGLGPHLLVPQQANRAGFGRAGAVTSLAGYLGSAGYRGYYATMLVNPLVFGFLGEFADGFTTSGLFHSNRFNTAAYLPVAAAFDYLGERVRGQWSDLEPPTDEVLGTRQTFDAARRLLKASSGRTFLWVHLAAPHAPYYAVDPADYEGTLQPGKYRRVTEHDLTHSTAAQAAAYEQVYEQYVRFADHEFGRFRAGLEADGLWDDALVIVTADHGEEFLPMQEPHGSGSLSEDVTRVPLLIHAPGQTRPARDDRPAGHLDLVPTVLERVLPAVPAGFEGRSLNAPPDPAHATFTWARFKRYIPEVAGDAAAIYAGDFKYVQDKDQEALYDLARDPRGRHDVAGRYPERLAALRARLREHYGP